MKKILISIIYFLAFIFSTKAQTLYGTTLGGGSYGGGTINKFIPATNSLTVAKSFENIDGADPRYTNLVQASNGKLYGMTSRGGTSDLGIIFSFDPSSSAYTKLKDFHIYDGASPYGSLIQASDGKLYGVTSTGGATGAGVIFSFDPSSATYTKVMDFDGVNGADPEGSLVQANDGKFYGVALRGGRTNGGVIFSFDPSSATYTRLADFEFPYTGAPVGNLIQASDGKLYGMTTTGGSVDAGVIFSFDPSSFSFTKVMDFDTINGAQPQGSLMQASDGKLYGVTWFGSSAGGDIFSGRGVIFSFDISSSRYTNLKDFDSTNGANPLGSLVQASDGKLYGMSGSGGSSNDGVIFSFDPLSLSYEKLKDFDKPIGRIPYSSLIQAGNGKFYGMTIGGGMGGRGVIFSFEATSSTYAKLKDFGTNESGSSVTGKLARASDGKLYGMTNLGGNHGRGVIFSFEPASSNYTKLKDFDDNDGANPYGSLIQASNGKLYGMTNAGGTSNAGVIFSYEPSSSSYAKLKDFDFTNTRTDGNIPWGSLMQASDGKLYGMTVGGGLHDFGVIFSLDPSTSTYTKLKDFEYGHEGYDPFGSLMQASDGKLYGLATSSCYGCGLIFSFDPSSSTYTKLGDMNCLPFTNSLIQASDGNIYGIPKGGTGNLHNGGIIFSFNPSTSTYTNLRDFDDITGHPIGDLMQAGDGKLYGMTAQGGSHGYGVIFSYAPSTSIYTKLKDFDSATGGVPLAAAFIEVNETLPVTLISFTGKNNGSKNQLSWKVDNEQDLNYYELQRSSDGQNFKEVSQIQATGNNKYTYNDPVNAATSSLYYYRLKSVDKDGKFKYSQIIKIKVNLNGFAVVTPNPFKNELVVNVESVTRDRAIFIITDISGKQLYKENKLLLPGTNVVEINKTKGLSKGTYLLTIIASQQSQTIRVVKGN